MKHILLFSFLVILSFQLSSQNLTSTIIPMTSGGQPVDMIESSSGYYYMGSYVTDKSEGFSNVQIEFVKTLPNGDTVWTKMIGGPKFDRVNKIIETKDGSLLILGYYTKSSEVSGDYYFVKMNEEGTILWEGTYGLDKSDYAWDVLETRDSTFVITGYLQDSISRFPALVEIDQSGNWEKEYIYHHFRENKCTFLASIQLENEDIIVAGTERFTDESGFSDDILLMRIHNLQDTVWTCFSSSDRIEYVNGMELINDTSFMISGYAYDTSLQVDIPFIQTFNVNGIRITSNYLEQYPGHKAEELIPYYNGTFLITGYARDPETNEDDIWLGQFDAMGKLLDYYLFKTSGYEIPRAMCLSSSREVLIFGLTFDQGGSADKHAVLLKLNPMGNSLPKEPIALTCGKDSLISLNAPYFGTKELSYSWVPEDRTGPEFSSNPIDLQLKNPENYLVSISDGTYTLIG